MPNPLVVSLGNPLLDIQVSGEEGLKYLAQYGLEADDAIVCEERHLPIFDEIVENDNATYVAGGAAQNAARAAAYILPSGSVAYIGSVGDDGLMRTLQKANDAACVRSAYQVQPSPARTGACAVIITGHHRSLCSTLGAAALFTPAHFATPDIAALLAGAEYFYLDGYFLPHGSDPALEVAKAASLAEKTVILNLSASFIPRLYKEQLEELLPHIDVVIGNASEAAAYAQAADIELCRDLAVRMEQEGG